MSEEILRALMELFALIVKQDAGILENERDYVVNFLEKQLSKESVLEYLALFDELAGPLVQSLGSSKKSSPTVKDSVKILGICRKINRTLNQEQKVVVLMRLYELVNADKQFTLQRMNIINTVSEVFKISQDEVSSIEQFIKNDTSETLSNQSIFVLSPGLEKCHICRRMHTGYQGTLIAILLVPSVDLFFLKYTSEEQLYLNGLPIDTGRIYTFATGGAIRTQSGSPIYYSDIVSKLRSDRHISSLAFNVEDLTYRFSEGTTAVNNVSFSVGEGKLLGILGSSGSGKTTLLNLMAGVLKPTSGTVKINGINILDNNGEIDGVFGYVPQDDLLIEDLTVFENLYYAACQCFGKKSKKEIVRLTDQTLANLGLLEKRNLKVGSPLNKVISGGQRKRLNIALELIREPSVLFLDEPTSGLSSRDSENLMDLLVDLTHKGKLVITVIHQPSSEIFKMFDKVIILDHGGNMAFFGNPVDSVIYFKTADSQINSTIGECPSCGNVNPETIFNIIETQVVDEFGRYTEKRKVKPEEWASSFRMNYQPEPVDEITEPPPISLERPSPARQMLIYLIRDLKRKIADRQYLLITLLEAPVLGFILSFIIRNIPNPTSDRYVFFENENIPIYIFMSLIVALFIGLTISAEEIFRDRKILKREHFLNLSRNSYLFSKISILFFISALQVILFVIIANPILELKGLFSHYFIALFCTAVCANMIGLNISAGLSSAITIYIVIPLIIIPMMVLSGAMFPFDKLNRKIGSVDKVPLIAELIPTRWTYEALMVAQFKDNRYNTFVDSTTGKTIYEMKKDLSTANFYTVKLIPGLISAVEITDTALLSQRISGDNESIPQNQQENGEPGKLELIRNELNELYSKYPTIPRFEQFDKLTPESYNPDVSLNLVSYLRFIGNSFSQFSNRFSKEWDDFYYANRTKIRVLENRYNNLKLEEIVTKFYERDKNKLLEYRNKFVQNYDPIYLDPDNKGFFAFRTHFFSPAKFIFGARIDTFSFNIGLVLLSTVILYLTLYFNILGRIITFFENLKFRK